MPPTSKVELCAAIRRDARAGLSGRALERKYDPGGAAASSLSQRSCDAADPWTGWLSWEVADGLWWRDEQGRQPCDLREDVGAVVSGASEGVGSLGSSAHSDNVRADSRDSGPNMAED
jgi:hypothetical protein